MHNQRLSPEFVLLGFLYNTPCHGYELHQRLRDEFGFIWHVSQSQTYNILKRLENQGFIKSKTVAQEKLPPRQELELTDRGLQRFHTWLHTPTNCSVHAIRVEFITRLYFIQQYFPEKSLEIIDKQIDEVSLGSDRLKKIRQNFPDDQVFNRLALELRIKLLDSILNWLDESRKEFLPSQRQGDGH